VATANYLSLPLLRKMEKAPDVLAVIDKNWGKVDAGADSIFDDFHGSSGKAAANVKKEDELKIEVSEERLLEEALIESVKLGQTLIALILMQENKDVLDKINPNLKENIAKIILMDMLAGI
jgi:hypothetical protein